MNPDIGSAGTRVLLAVMAQTRPTVRSVAAEVDRSVNATHAHLVRLRELGLVAWEDGKAGTLRPTVRTVSDLRKRDLKRTSVRSASCRMRVLAQDASGPRTADTAGDLDETRRGSRRARR